MVSFDKESRILLKINEDQMKYVLLEVFACMILVAIAGLVIFLCVHLINKLISEVSKKPDSVDLIEKPLPLDE